MADSVPFTLGDVEFSLEKGSVASIEEQVSWWIDRAEPISGYGVCKARRKNYHQVRISGVVFPGYFGDTESVNRLRALGDAGEPILLMSGEGTVYGFFLVVQVTETRSHFDTAGNARKSEWQLILEPEGGEE
jgi:phage protein U